MNYRALAFMAILVGCSGQIQNSNMVRPPNSGSGAQPCPSGGSHSFNLAAAPVSSGNWLGGVLNYTWLQYERSLEAPPESKESCSALLEFSKDAFGRYRVGILTNERCIDTLPASRGADISVWKDAADGMSGGYIKLRLKNPEVDKLFSILKETPEDPKGMLRAAMSDIAYSGQLVPGIQGDVKNFLPAERLGDAALLCGDPQQINDSPTPKSCIWPHGMQWAEYGVEAVSGQSSQADIDAFVAKTLELRAKRNGSTLVSREAATLLASYVDDMKELQVRSRRVRHWVWLNRVLNNSTVGNGEFCNDDPERRAACARVMTKYFIPEKRAAIEQAIAAGFPAETGTQFRAEMFGTVHANYSAQLARVLDKWKALGKILDVERKALRIAAHLPADGSEAAFQFAPLFPATTQDGSSALSGVKWSLKDGHLEVDFDSSQRVLRRPIDTGAIVLLGDFPLLALLRNAPESDGAGSLVLPAPRSGTSQSSQSNCVTK